MDETSRLEALGYRRGEDGQWAHEALGLRLVDPDHLLAQPQEALAPLHDPGRWALDLPEPRPPEDPALAEAIERCGLIWEPWPGAWQTPDGALLTHAELAALGPAALHGIADQQAAWRREQEVRNRGGCLGLGAMTLWLLVGWSLGTWIWLAGMAVIAGVSWRYRPLKARPDPFEGVEGIDLEALMDRAAAQLPPGWQDLPVLTPVLPAADGHVYLPQLWAAIRADSLTGFDRAAFEALVGSTVSLLHAP